MGFVHLRFVKVMRFWDVKKSINIMEEKIGLETSEKHNLNIILPQKVKVSNVSIVQVQVSPLKQVNPIL